MKAIIKYVLRVMLLTLVIFTLATLTILDVDVELEKETGVYIVSSDTTPIGTAFKVGKHKVVTAKHVCEYIGSIELANISNKVESKLIKSIHIYPYLGYDMCVMKTYKKLNGYEYKISNNGVSKYQYLQSLGYPHAKLPIEIKHLHVKTQLEISKPFYFMDVSLPAEYFIRTNKPIIRGMSGGPVLNDEGLVIGLNARTSKQESLITPLYEYKIREYIYEI
jgi:hypothetical protein